MVEYDSIIPPGRVGKVTGEVKIAGMHGGSFKKSITVLSNAADAPSLRLTLGGTIRTIVGTSKTYLRLSPDATGLAKTSLEFTTEKDDLVVTSVSFVNRREKSNIGWLSQRQLQIGYSTVVGDSADSSGLYTYGLGLSLSGVGKERLSGDFVFKTNHPEKQEIKIRGMIDVSR